MWSWRWLLGIALCLTVCFQAEAATPPTAQELGCWRRITAWYRANYVRDIRDGCEIRANAFLGSIATYCPGSAHKLFQVWTRGLFVPANGVAWRFHTTLAFLGNDGVTTVLDPAFATQEISFRDWKRSCNPQGASISVTTLCGQKPQMIAELR